MSEEAKRDFEVTWRIENIKSWLQIRHDSIYSPPFLAETLMNTRWKLKVSPNWQLGEKYVSLTLQRDIEDDHPDPIDLNYELLFLAGDGTPLKSKRFSKNFATKTASHKLNVKQNVILDENETNGAYLSEDVLTVGCKLWKKSFVSNVGWCSLFSAIGTNQLTLKESFCHLDPPFLAPVYFSPPTTDISMIHLDVYVSEEGFIFEKKQIECKNIAWYSCKLFALNGKGYKTEFDDKLDLTEVLLPSKNSQKLKSIDTSDFLFRYFPHGKLTLQLEIEYYPGIVEEHVESGCFELMGKLPCKVDDQDNDIVNDSKIVQKIRTHGSRSLKICYDEKCELGDEDKSSDDEDSSDDAWLNDDEESSDEEKHFIIAGKRNFQFTTLEKDLTSMFNDHLFCDTKLQTDTETFQAHRSVLSARSPVFKKLFTIDMKEKGGECVFISDISSKCMSQMLQFMYTDSIPDLEIQSAKDLYLASDKYNIPSLKKCCSYFIKNSLCISNVCEVLVLADAHQDKDLEREAQKFVLKNYKEILLSDEWKLFMKNYSSLAVHIMYLKGIRE